MVKPGAIGGLWGPSDATLPIPGFRMVAHVDDLAGASHKGPIPQPVMAEIEAAIQRAPEGPPRKR